MSQGARFVWNDSAKGRPVVHTVDCSAIQHQVRGDEFPAQGPMVYDEIGVDENGNSIYRESRAYEWDAYRAFYKSADEVARSGRVYRRCRVCSPDIPDYVPPLPSDQREVLARSIKPKHFGRRFLEIGALEEVRMFADRYVLVGSEGTTETPLDGRVRYIVE
jgi:hypothetical protein